LRARGDRKGIGNRRGTAGEGKKKKNALRNKGEKKGFTASHDADGVVPKFCTEENPTRISSKS